MLFRSCWLEERVRKELMPYEANAVLSIPLSNRQSEDTLIWQKSKKGVYTTKSAYCLLADNEALKQHRQSNPIANNGRWKKLWSLDIPNKVKHFLWCASWESLPTKKNLIKRKIAHNDMCEICDGEAEDTIHALWDCHVLKKIWWEMDICRNNLSTWLTCFRDLLTGILNSQEPNQAKVFASVAWEIWRKRNALRVGVDTILYPKIFREANERLHDFQVAQTNQILTFQKIGITSQVPPPCPLLKVNFDGAVFQDTYHVGIGVVIKDSEGKVLSALSERTKLHPTVDDVEAMACRRAIEFAIESGLQQALFEGDSATVINYINDGQPCLASFEHIIEDAIDLTSHLCYCSFSHVQRKGNAVANKVS